MQTMQASWPESLLLLALFYPIFCLFWTWGRRVSPYLREELFCFTRGKESLLSLELYPLSQIIFLCPLFSAVKEAILTLPRTGWPACLHYIHKIWAGCQVTRTLGIQVPKFLAAPYNGEYALSLSPFLLLPGISTPHPHCFLPTPSQRLAFTSSLFLPGRRTQFQHEWIVLPGI